MAIYFEHITVSKFQLSSIYKLNILQEVNKHATMYLECI